MAGVYRRPTDKARGAAGKWTCWWIGADGRKHSCAGVTDKKESERIARHLEAEARLVRKGLVDPGEVKRRDASLKPLAEHVESFRLELIHRERDRDYCAESASKIARLLSLAEIESIADLDPERIQEALWKMREHQGRSARTCNAALVAVRSFAKWLAATDRIKEAPKALASIPLYNEKTDRRRVRRALTDDELERLFAAAERGGPEIASAGPRSGKRSEPRLISGPDRAALYRISISTGFRANELRSLTPERFELEGDDPSITVLACYSKRGRDDCQPIRRDFARALAPWLSGRPPGEPVVAVPRQTARVLRIDLAAAGIPYVDDRGRVADFHALRHSYITNLVKSGMNVKIVQKLARHSTITLTLDRYTDLTDDDVRGALEGNK